MSAIDFRISTARLGRDAYILSLGGEVDLHTVPKLDEELEAAAADGARRVIVDLAAAPFIDSSVLGALARAQRELTARGGELVLVTDDRRILRLLEVSGLERLFRIERSLTEAISGLAGSAVHP